MDSKFLLELTEAVPFQQEEVELGKKKFIVRELDNERNDYWKSDSTKRVKVKMINQKPVPDMSTLDLTGQEVLLVALSVVNPETNEVAFDYKDQDTLNALKKMPTSAIKKIIEVAYRLNGFDKEVEKAKAEQAEKN